MTATGDALPPEVLAGKTFSVTNKVNLSGTMVNNGARKITPGAAAQSISAGFHNGSGYVEGDPDLIPANIASGKRIFGVSGSIANTCDESGEPDLVANNVRDNTWIFSVQGVLQDRTCNTIGSYCTGIPGNCTFDRNQYSSDTFSRTLNELKNDCDVNDIVQACRDYGFVLGLEVTCQSI